MSDVVIRAEGLGKKYLIGHQANRERYTALRDVMVRTARGFARSAFDMVRGQQLVVGDEIEEFWALKDVSFEIRRGEVVGIVGRNGAGKSTLLKILSRITEPSQGRVEIKGRVASLLEVGTGFHPELSGRENIYLNGAILGMTRVEIRRKFDEIVAFAEVEKFLDTPVKRYSSGMYVRLAFAVAAHLEPEILVVDEVLAVGDAEFQKKCLGKMHDVADHGRTVLFVSHNIGSIQVLCESCLLLRDGSIEFIGPTDQVVRQYHKSIVSSHSYSNLSGKAVELIIRDATLSVAEPKSDCIVICIDVTVEAIKNVMARLDIRLKDDLGTPIGFASIGEPDLSQMVTFNGGYNKLRLECNPGNLIGGRYLVSLDLVVPNVRYFQRLEDCLSFDLVRNVNIFGTPAPSQSWGFGSLYFASTLNCVGVS